jgi:hypothetical protein
MNIFNMKIKIKLKEQLAICIFFLLKFLKNIPIRYYFFKLKKINLNLKNLCILLKNLRVKSKM